MIGFWSVFGLCSIDKRFRDDLSAAAVGKEPSVLYDFLKNHTNLPMSRFEVEDIRRILENPQAALLMDQLANLIWDPGCPVGVGYSPDYVHPGSSQEAGLQEASQVA